MLDIVSSCVKEFVNYIFIIFDKTIISYILEKSEKDLY